MGFVYLVGAGPGDPGLLTLRAARLIGAADAILHDSLIDADVLAMAPPHALLIDVGKRCGGRSTQQAAINALLIAEANRADRRIVLRLKGGDPAIFGRATEEIEALREAGIGFEIVPGVTAAAAAAAALGRSLTTRGIARSVHIITGHGARGGGAEDDLPAHDFAALARAGGTLAVYMGAHTARGLATHLIEAGLPPDLPAVIAEAVSTASERLRPTTLANLPGQLDIGTDLPVLLLIGAAMAEPQSARAGCAAARAGL